MEAARFLGLTVSFPKTNLWWLAAGERCPLVVGDGQIDWVGQSPC